MTQNLSCTAALEKARDEGGFAVAGYRAFKYKGEKWWFEYHVNNPDTPEAFWNKYGIEYGEGALLFTMKDMLSEWSHVMTLEEVG